jgi:hypothetical protein
MDKGVGEAWPRRRRNYYYVLLTIGSTCNCLTGSEVSAMDVSVSAPLPREREGAIFSQPLRSPKKVLMEALRLYSRSQ